MRPIVFRPGNWLIGFHPEFIRKSLIPRFFRYSPNWWSFVWIGVEVCRAWDEDQ